MVDNIAEKDTKESISSLMQFDKQTINGITWFKYYNIDVIK